MQADEFRKAILWGERPEDEKMDEIELIYVGDGFLPGVPARDLTGAEVKACGGRGFLLKTGLYRLAGVEDRPVEKAVRKGRVEKAVEEH